MVYDQRSARSRALYAGTQVLFCPPAATFRLTFLSNVVAYDCRHSQAEDRQMATPRQRHQHGCPTRPTPSPAGSGCAPPARVLAGDGRDDAGDRRRYDGGARCRGRERAPAIEPLVPFGGRAKLPAERAERAETFNPSEIEAFSTMARRGGNRRKPPAETLLGQPAAFFCLTLGVHSSSQYRHRLRKLRKLLLPAGNDTAATRLLLL